MSIQVPIHKFLEPYVANIASMSVDEAGISEFKRQIKAYIESCSRRLTSRREFSALVTALAQSGEHLLSWNDYKDSLKLKFVGLAVLHCLLDVNDDVAGDRRIVIAGYIRRIFELDKPGLEALAPVINMAGQTIGHFAKGASTNEIDYLQSSYLALIRKSLADNKSDCRRYSALVILYSIASGVPHVIYSNHVALIPPMYELIMEPNELIRNAAASALESCLCVFSYKESISDTIKSALRIVDEELGGANADKVIGALLILEVICRGNVISSINLNAISFKYEELIWKVISLMKNSKVAKVISKVIELLPVLVNAFPRRFCKVNSLSDPYPFLYVSVKYLTEFIRTKSALASPSLYSLGKIFASYNLESKDFNILFNFMEMLETIRETLQYNDTRVAALNCLGLFVTHVPIAKKLIDVDIVLLVFKGGFTEALVNNLKIVASNVPLVRSELQKQLQSSIFTYFSEGQLNNETTLIILEALMTEEFSPKADLEIIRDSDDATNIGKLFFGLLKITSNFVVKLLDDDVPQVRRLAALSCTFVLDTMVSYYEPQTSAVFLEMSQIVDRLLLQSISDDEHIVRVDLLNSFTPSLDKLLALSSNTNCLVEALSDSSLSIRSAALSILSRISSFDTVRVLPILCFQLKQLIKQLNSSEDANSKYETVVLLQSLVKWSDTIIFPYIPLVLTALLPLIKDSTPEIKDISINIIGEIGFLSPECVKDYIDTIFPELIRLLNDPFSSVKRETIVVAIGKLVPALITVTSEPYKRYPMLLEGMLRVIKRDTSDNSSKNSIQNQNDGANSSKLQLEAIRTTGLLGVVDNKLYSQHLENTRKLELEIFGTDNFDEESHKIADDDEFFENIQFQSPEPEEKSGQDSQDKSSESKNANLAKQKANEILYFSIAVRQLVSVLRDDSSQDYHHTACIVILKVIQLAGASNAFRFKPLIDAMLFRLYKTSPGNNLRERIINNLSTSVKHFGKYIKIFLSDLIKVFNDFAGSNLTSCVALVEAFFNNLPLPYFQETLKEILPALMETMSEKMSSFTSSDDVSNQNSKSLDSAIDTQRAKSESNEITKLLKLFIIISPKVGNMKLQLILSAASVVNNSHISKSTRKLAIVCMFHLCDSEVSLRLHGHTLIQTLLKSLNSNPENMPLHGTIFTALSVAMCRLQSLMLPFVTTTKRKIAAIYSRNTLVTAIQGPLYTVQLEEFEGLLSNLLKKNPLPNYPNNLSEFQLPMFENGASLLSGTSNEDQMGPFKISIEALQSAWSLLRDTEADIIEWKRRLSAELIRQSPSPIIRACSQLATEFRPLAEELFNSAFHSLWSEFFVGKAFDIGEEVPIVDTMEKVLKSPFVPYNIMCSLLNLAEFMEMQGCAIPIDIHLLAERSKEANMFSKCVRYKEIEMASTVVPPSQDCILTLISVNNELGMGARAKGVLDVVLNSTNITVEPLWLENLDKWEDAKKIYEDLCSNYAEKFKVQASEEMKNGSLLDNNENAAKFKNWKPSNYITCELGIMRSLEALGDYEALLPLAKDLTHYLSKHSFSAKEFESNIQNWFSETQRIGANAAWHLGQWSDMDSFFQTASASEEQMNLTMSSNVLLNQNQNFYKTILAIHKQDFHKALSLIADTRQSLSSAISTLLSEGYPRAKRALVSMQILAEMEEVIEFKQISNASSNTSRNPVSISSHHASAPIDIHFRKSELIKKWRGRLQWAPRDVSVFRQILDIHSLVLDPIEDLDSWLDLVALCRKEMKFTLCENILRQLGAPIPKISSDGIVSTVVAPGAASISLESYNRVLYDTYKFWWESGRRSEALEGLNKLIASYQSIQLNENNITLKVRCLLKKAHWIRELGQNEKLPEAMSAINEAQELVPDRYNPWHSWALANFQQLSIVDPSFNSTIGGSFTCTNSKRTTAISIAIAAIKGFVKSITLNESLHSSDVLQDLLRLITLWFNYGIYDQVSDVLNTELSKVSADNWLAVLPQLIARMHNKALSSQLQHLLIHVASVHPQACIYPISVAMNTNDINQKLTANEILQDMRKRQSQLVEEAGMVSSELMRVAITPFEQWYAAIETACENYLAGNMRGMLYVLFNIHASLDGDSSQSESFSFLENVDPSAFPYNDVLENLKKGVNPVVSEDSETLGFQCIRDVAFRHLFGRCLAEAKAWLMRFIQTGCSTDLHQAWDVYYYVFESVKVHFRSFKSLNMSQLSPYLTKATNLSLTVPGVYRTNAKVISIAKFSDIIDVIPSKQRPRKIKIIGSDGNKYIFLLKGNEDLRLDERVMQLFGLINTCLNRDRANIDKGLHLVRYSVLPLSNNSGVIGWIENCDTLNALIGEYRSSRGIKPTVELNLLRSKSLNYDLGYSSKVKNTLTLMQKVEIFRSVLDDTAGVDVAHALWTSSRTADIWVERRSNFTNSMALMSMTGYILGLGDRHPSNLMLDRSSGRIIHIDFGDCFEVTKYRAKFAECVPFRLTRMLTNCMGQAGLRGPFREGCMQTMSVLRENKDSVMAMLEAFVYNPLISWKFLTGTNNTEAKKMQDEQGATEIPESVMKIANVTSEDRTSLHINTAQSPVETNEDHAEAVNGRALEVILRIQSKLTGTDFTPLSQQTTNSAGIYMPIEAQVERLISEATSDENLCQLFAGWCPLW